MRAALDRLGRDRQTFSVIHADLHAGNVLVDGDRLTVIDFDDSGFGWHHYDAAVALFHFQARDEFATIQRGFVRGYRTKRHIYDDALALIPMFLMIRGMAVIGWISQRPELDTSRVPAVAQGPRLRPMRDVRTAVLNACAATGAGFLTAVLWFDLMFDVQTRQHRGDVLPGDVLASIGAYYRRVTTDANR